MASLIWSYVISAPIQLFGSKERATLGVEYLIIVLLVIMCLFVTRMLDGIGDSEGMV
ncbi:hypothetical protein JVU11DRAFT_9147 [Chiua virens]|nr:hypothetical protein JVU11DRAFT_9147 [Chiua virens]